MQAWRSACVLMLGMLCWTGVAHAQASLNLVPYQIQEVNVLEKLEDRVDMDLRFTDYTGQEVRLGDYFDGEKPVLLTLNYYSCATLCSVQLNALLQGLRELEWTAGEEFRIVTVSIDPREDAALANAKRESYLAELGRGDDLDWNFLVGEEDQVRALADAVGFTYKYDNVTKQYAHPAVVMFLSGEGVVSRYLYGITLASRDLKFALIETSAGRVGDLGDKIILSCFRYNSSDGRYTATIFGIARLGGVLTVLGLMIAGAIAWRRELLPRPDGSPT
jgi:protein SCO1/2